MGSEVGYRESKCLPWGWISLPTAVSKVRMNCHTLFSLFNCYWCSKVTVQFTLKCAWIASCAVTRQFTRFFISLHLRTLCTLLMLKFSFYNASPYNIFIHSRMDDWWLFTLKWNSLTLKHTVTRKVWWVLLDATLKKKKKSLYLKVKVPVTITSGRMQNLFWGIEPTTCHCQGRHWAGQLDQWWLFCAF